MPLIIYEAHDVASDRSKFVEFWEAQYNFGQGDDDFYNEHVNQPLTEERILEWYKWKNGMKRLSDKKLLSVQRNFINRRAELDTISMDASARSVLDRFANGGAIWRIFWLHCWQPERFPIYDQHVHRAMRFIQDGVVEEIPTNERRKIDLYINNYLSFHAEFRNLEFRSVDKALWAFGKFLSDYKEMLP